MLAGQYKTRAKEEGRAQSGNGRRLTAREVRRLPASERDQLLLESAEKAAKEFDARPELIIRGGEELHTY